MVSKNVKKLKETTLFVIGVLLASNISIDFKDNSFPTRDYTNFGIVLIIGGIILISSTLVFYFVLNVSQKKRCP